MVHSTSDRIEELDTIARDVIARHAVEVDRQGLFPQVAIDALSAAGFLGAISATDVGGWGQGPDLAVRIIERVARECGSTAMVLCMHYSGTAVLEKHAPEQIRRDAAAGTHLSTLAFSEAGSRSHFWAPVSTAQRDATGVRLDASKSWVTSANHATAYVWSSRPIEADGPSTIWLVPADAKGLSVAGPFDGLGLRGNDSSPVSARGVVVPETAMLGSDGGGFAIMMQTVLPLFNLLNAACSVGFMQSACERTATHAGGTRYAHLDSALAELPTIRNYVARMRVQTDMARALLFDAVDAVGAGRDDAMLRVLESKAAAGEAATHVLDLAMRVCGGAAFRKDVGVERPFRDARAAGVMAPTTDVLYDFIGKAVCGLDLF
jgi:alkylation response protein AidB-like acyl-CoA dehydrogenase